MNNVFQLGGWGRGFGIGERLGSLPQCQLCGSHLVKTYWYKFDNFQPSQANSPLYFQPNSSHISSNHWSNTQVYHSESQFQGPIPPAHMQAIYITSASTLAPYIPHSNNTCRLLPTPSYPPSFSPPIHPPTHSNNAHTYSFHSCYSFQVH